MKNQLLVPIALSLTIVSGCDESWQNAFVAAGEGSSVMQYNNPPAYSNIYATYDDDYADASSGSSTYDSSPSEPSGFNPPPSANTSRSTSPNTSGSSGSDIGPILVEKKNEYDSDNYERRLAESKRAFAEQQAKRAADAEAERIRKQEIVQQRDAERAARCRAKPGSIDCPGVR